MQGISKVSDLTIGFGTHGSLCCPHVILGIIITGSPNTIVNGIPMARTGDIGIHNCPHCPINMCITGSPNTLANGRQIHRIGDLVTEFCGIGFTVTGSINTLCN